MHKDTELAQKKLIDGGYTCVVLKNGVEYCSCERGVQPLLALLDSGESFCGAVAADKTVGAGAAHLYVLLGVCSIWANVISVSAKQILEDNGIEIFCGECVPHIINRQGTGICPIECAVADAKTSSEAYELIIKALARLRQKQSEAENKAQMVKMLKALADDNRLEIMQLLMSGAKCGCELLDALKIGQSTLSHHMKILCDAGLVDASKEGKWMHYSLSAKGAESLKEGVDKYVLPF